MGNMKEINIKNQTYYFFNDMINIKNFDSNSIKIGKNSYRNIYIYYIGNIAIKNMADYKNIHSVDHLYFIIGKVDGFIEEGNGNNYLVFASTNKNKDVLKKHTELWDEIQYLRS